MAPDQANDNKPITFPTAAIADQVNAADLFIQGKLQELVRQNDPNDNMDPEVEEILMELATDFIQSVTGFACRLANHRKSDTLEVKDLKLHLERQWNIRVPGFATDDIRSLRKPATAPAHEARVHAVHAARNARSGHSARGAGVDGSGV